MVILNPLKQMPFSTLQDPVNLAYLTSAVFISLQSEHDTPLTVQPATESAGNQTLLAIRDVW